MIYFDNSATTKPYPEVLETYMQVASKILGNPSSLHRLGDQATRILDASRQQIADLIGKKSDEIFLPLVGQKEIIGSSRVWPLKKPSFASTSSYQPLNIQQSRNQPSG